MIKPITQEDLLKEYILDETSEELLYLNAPYFIKIKTTEQTAFTFIKDSVNSLSRILNANQENNLETNSKISELIFSSTVGLINVHQFNGNKTGFKLKTLCACS